MFLWVLCDFLDESSMLLEKFWSLGLLGRFMAVPCFLCVEIRTLAVVCWSPRVSEMRNKTDIFL
ncbi:hypothetical protein LDENG_00212680 [Lucifuga dentata]|nr:hypothetical protein LDENG_00212680 [Lucifuga dentata]